MTPRTLLFTVTKMTPRTLLFTIVFLATSAGAISGWLRQELVEDEPLIVAARSVPALTMLTTSDLTIAQPGRSAEAPEMINALVGQITSGTIDANEPVTSELLLKLPELPPNDWLVLHVPATEPPDNLEVGSVVQLYGARDDSSRSVIVTERAIVLAVEEESVAVTLSEKSASLAAGYLLPERKLVMITRLSK